MRRSCACLRSASRSSSASAEVTGLSWVYPYVEDPHSSGVYDPDNIVLRPVLEIEMFGLALDDAPPRVAALVDSGAERKLPLRGWRALWASIYRAPPRSWLALVGRPDVCALPT